MDQERSHSRRMLGMALAAQTCSTLPVFLLGSLSPFLMADLGLNPFNLGIGIAIFYAASALGSLVLAPMSDKGGVWKITHKSLVALIGANAVIALGSMHWSIVFALMFVAGVANGCIQPATNVIVSRFVPSQRQGFAFGLKQCAIPVATLIGGVAVPVIGLTVGWRIAFGLAAVLTACVMLLAPRKGTLVAPTNTSAAKYLPRNALICLTIMSAFGAGSANAMAAFLVPSIVAAGHSAAAAGITMAGGSILSIAVRIGLGSVADRYNLPLLRLVAILFAGGAAAYLIFAVGGDLSVIVGATMLAFGMGWGWSGITILAIARASVGSVGAATGVTQAGVFAGAVIGPVAFGWLAHAYSYEAAWQMLAAIALLAAAMAFASSRIIRRGQGTATSAAKAHDRDVN